MPEPIRVVLAEDNYLVREGTRRLLEDTAQVRVLAAVGTATELLDAVSRLAPGVVITDIRMPPRHHMDGIDAAHTIRAQYPGIGVVVLSQHDDEEYAFALLKHGTDGLAYLLKDRVADTDDLLHALHAVMAGRSVIDPDVVASLIARRVRLDQSPLATLTTRELDVLRAMAEGETNTAIAGTLALSRSSVEKHVNAIFTKLGLHDDTHLQRRVTAVLTFLRDTGIHRATPSS